MTVAIVLGGANCLWADLAEAQRLIGPDHLIIAANHAGRDYSGEVAHHCTMHPELFPDWIAARAKHGRPPAGQLWHARHRPVKVESRPIESWGGSSGMLCVAVAFELGIERIVLAGVPMQKLNRHYDDAKPWIEARQYWPAWERRIPQLRNRVKSMSGWTREQLGEPDAQWFEC